MLSLQTYSQLHNMSMYISYLEFEELRHLLFETDEVRSSIGKSKMWSEICSILPQRSIRSCYRFLKRQLDPSNYQGSWSEKEEEILLMLIDKYGRKWKMIAKELNRSAENIKDKYKQLG